jgi:putative nucleotidyltransferase with HDIG domain
MDYFVLKKVMSAIRELPTLPSVVNRINQLLNDPKTQVGDLARVISADQSLSVRVLKLINSAYHGGGPSKTNDIQQAIVRLGFRSVAQTVTNVSICSMFKDDSEGLFDRAEFWRHSVAVAVLSRMLAAEARHPRPDEAFTCGLLHDIGKLILDQYLHEEMTAALLQAREKRISFHQAERVTYQVDHTTVGEMAAKAWRLPMLVVVSIKHHHTRLEDRKGIPLSDDITVDFVRLADYLARDMQIGHSGDGAPPEWVPEIAGRVAVTPEAIERIRAQCLPDIESAVSFLDLPRRAKSAGAA